MKSDLEILLRQGENLLNLLSHFEITENQLADALFTQQQTISKYVTGKKFLSAKTESDIIAYLKQDFGFSLNPGYIRGLNDRMEQIKINTVNVDGAEYYDLPDEVIEESFSVLDDHTVESLLSFLGYDFSVSGIGCYDVYSSGRKICENVSGEIVQNMFEDIRQYAIDKAEKLIKHNKPKQ